MELFGNFEKPEKEISMKKRSRRNFNAAFKTRVALEAIKGHKTLAELSAKFDVHSIKSVNGYRLSKKT